MIVVIFTPLSNDATSGPISECMEIHRDLLAGMNLAWVEVSEWREDWSHTHEVVAGVVTPRPSEVLAALELVQAKRRLKVRRNLLLRDFVDPIVTNPLRWSGLTESQQASLQAYRQALLDWPETEADPMNPTEPSAPSF